MSIVTRVDEVQTGDFVEAWDEYGEVLKVTKIGRSIGDGTVDWYFLRVQFENDHHPENVGPLRADKELRNWSR